MATPIPAMSSLWLTVNRIDRFWADWPFEPEIEISICNFDSGTEKGKTEMVIDALHKMGLFPDDVDYTLLKFDIERID